MDEIKIEGEPRPPIKVGTVMTVDMETGEVVAERPNAFTMLPAAAGTCPECAMDHPHDQPHNQQSLTYQYRFRATHGRWPTWTDAMSHCTPEVREAWRTSVIAAYRLKGRAVPEDLLEPGLPVR